MDVLVLTYTLRLMNPAYPPLPPQIESEGILNVAFEAAMRSRLQPKEFNIFGR